MGDSRLGMCVSVLDGVLRERHRFKRTVGLCGTKNTMVATKTRKKRRGERGARGKKEATRLDPNRKIITSHRT